jgi:type I restriction enzyme S subunit
MDLKTFFDNFETIANALGGITRLRELILDLAVQGKLSSASESDRDIASLLADLGEAIEPYEEMSEIRFEIPFHWTWVPLASVVEHQLGKMLHTSKMKGVRKKYLRSVNVRQDGQIDLTDVKEMLIPESELTKYAVRVGDVFVNEGGDVGRNAIWLKSTNEEFAFQNQLHRLRPICGVESRYVQFVLQQAKSAGVIAAMSTGVTIQHFSATSLRKFAFPLPPIDEQKRIVAKVDELMALCDDLEATQNQRDSIRTAARKSAIDSISTATTPDELNTGWKRISNNWTTIADTPESVASLRSLILDLAVHGKLSRVETGDSNPNLLITALKSQKRADEAILKRSSKSLLQVANSTPSRFPAHWANGCLGDFCFVVMGNSPPGESYNDREIGVPLINGPVEFSSRPLGKTRKTKFTTAATYMCREGDMLVCVRGATTGRTNVAGFDACIGRGVALVRGYEIQDFINLFMWQVGTELLAAGKGTTFPSVSYKDLVGLPIGIPPIEEQKRIVARVELLLNQCDELENVLETKAQIEYKILNHLAVSSLSGISP